MLGGGERSQVLIAWCRWFRVVPVELPFAPMFLGVTGELDKFLLPENWLMR